MDVMRALADRTGAARTAPHHARAASEPRTRPVPRQPPRLPQRVESRSGEYATDDPARPTASIMSGHPIGGWPTTFKVVVTIVKATHRGRSARCGRHTERGNRLTGDPPNRTANGMAAPRRHQFGRHISEAE
ncbi:hypothetical protein JCM9533A_55550 [Catenuloplanes niger JCM 9533]